MKEKTIIFASEIKNTMTDAPGVNKEAYLAKLKKLALLLEQRKISQNADLVLMSFMLEGYPYYLRSFADVLETVLLEDQKLTMQYQNASILLYPRMTVVERDFLSRAEQVADLYHTLHGEYDVSELLYADAAICDFTYDELVRKNKVSSESLSLLKPGGQMSGEYFMASKKSGIDGVLDILETNNRQYTLHAAANSVYRR